MSWPILNLNFSAKVPIHKLRFFHYNPGHRITDRTANQKNAQGGKKNSLLRLQLNQQR